MNTPRVTRVRRPGLEAFAWAAVAGALLSSFALATLGALLIGILAGVLWGTFAWWLWKVCGRPPGKADPERIASAALAVIGAMMCPALVWPQEQPVFRLLPGPTREIRRKLRKRHLRLLRQLRRFLLEPKEGAPRLTDRGAWLILVLVASAASVFATALYLLLLLQRGE